MDINKGQLLEGRNFIKERICCYLASFSCKSLPLFSYGGIFSYKKDSVKSPLEQILSRKSWSYLRKASLSGKKKEKVIKVVLLSFKWQEGSGAAFPI